MSIGKAPSESKSTQGRNEHSGSSSSASRHIATQQASSSSKNKPHVHAFKVRKHHAPEECQTWYQFKQLYEAKFADKDMVAQFTMSERVSVTRQALDLVSRAIVALESDIRDDPGLDYQQMGQGQNFQRLLHEFQADKLVLDEIIASLPQEVDTVEPVKQEMLASILTIDDDDDIMQIISTLREQSLDRYAEQKRNRHMSGRQGLIDGAQILDDYTQARIAEFNRKVILEGRKISKKLGH